MALNHLADHILAVAKRNGYKVTNLQLQKVMFFSLGLHIRRQNQIDDLAEEIYSGAPFSKWKYGPVVEEIYYNYNHYGAESIGSEGNYNPDYESLNDIITNLLKVDVFQLVDLSHKLDSWKNYGDDIVGMKYVAPYTLKEIAKDFIDE
ncbi:DUF4065 domain-containing protein [Oceanobacillus caeni]|uniref:Panacea domain-containing protein n=1 Tax=Oceanobacillus caeni TaxID=405946 RepID=UPI002149B6F0|nr:type II toxin-antitoxin system antitoxin SocA domain-containing protein [Oceanobacillus caeni]MCR1834960.1 DUF4065 domain-containing protein [Oceanobacillus caeni]